MSQYSRWRPGKKTIAALVGIGLQFLPWIDADTKAEVTKLVIGFIVGQGVADAGKERALIEAGKS
jgi:hypothetical protein